MVRSLMLTRRHGCKYFRLFGSCVEICVLEAIREVEFRESEASAEPCFSFFRVWQQFLAAPPMRWSRRES